MPGAEFSSGSRRGDVHQNIMTACNPLTMSAPKAPRGGKGFEARYQAWLAECAKVDAHNARLNRSDAAQFYGLSNCNDCADGLGGTAWHRRGANFNRACPNAVSP